MGDEPLPIRNPDPLLSMKEAATYCGTSRATLYREMDRHAMSYVRIRSRRLVRKSECERYLAARTLVA